MKIVLHIIKNNVMAFKRIRKDSDVIAFISRRAKGWGGFAPTDDYIAKKVLAKGIYWCTEHSNFAIINVK